MKNTIGRNNVTNLKDFQTNKPEEAVPVEEWFSSATERYDAPTDKLTTKLPKNDLKIITSNDNIEE